MIEGANEPKNKLRAKLKPRERSSSENVGDVWGKVCE